MSTQSSPRNFSPVASLRRDDCYPPAQGEPAVDDAAHRPLEQALAPRYLAWLRYENHHGANVYVAANPLRPGSRKRTKESIAEVRHLYIDIDEDGEARIARSASIRCRAGSELPILSTSPGKYQVLWRVEGFDFDQQERRSSCSPSPSVAIPLAPTATGFFASPVSATASTIPLTPSRSNTSTIQL